MGEQDLLQVKARSRNSLSNDLQVVERIDEEVSMSRSNIGEDGGAEGEYPGKPGSNPQDSSSLNGKARLQMTSFQEILDTSSVKGNGSSTRPEERQFEFFSTGKYEFDIYAFFSEGDIQWWRKAVIILLIVAIMIEWVFVGIDLGMMFRDECNPESWEICRVMMSVLFYLGISLLELNFAMMEVTGQIKYVRRVFMLVPFGFNCLEVVVLFNILAIDSSSCSASNELYTPETFENFANALFAVPLCVGAALLALNILKNKFQSFSEEHSRKRRLLQNTMQLTIFGFSLVCFAASILVFSTASVDSLMIFKLSHYSFILLLGALLSLACKIKNKDILITMAEVIRRQQFEISNGEAGAKKLEQILPNLQPLPGVSGLQTGESAPRLSKRL